MSHLRRVNPPASTATNDLARRVSLLHAIAADLDATDFADLQTDADRMMLLNSRMGEIADAYRFGHKDISSEYRRLLVAAWAVVEDDLSRAAR